MQNIGAKMFSFKSANDFNWLTSDDESFYNELVFAKLIEDSEDSYVTLSMCMKAAEKVECCDY